MTVAFDHHILPSTDRERSARFLADVLGLPEPRKEGPFLALDLAFPGALMPALDPAHGLTGLLAIVLMGFGLAAAAYQPPRRVLLLDPDSLLILVLYLASIGWLYARSVGG